MAEFWEIIVKTNTFNFVILVIIFAVVCVKFNIPKVLENIKNDIATAINNAEQKKIVAEKELKKASKLVKNTDNEVQEKLKIAKKNAKTLVNDINKTTTQQIEHIQNNINRVIESEEKKATSELSSNTINSAIELAKNTIIENLKIDKTLHTKLIEKSIKELREI